MSSTSSTSSTAAKAKGNAKAPQEPPTHGYRCPKCRSLLFTSTHVIPHSESTDGGDASWRFRGKGSTTVGQAHIATSDLGGNPDDEGQCTVINFKPPRWMKSELDAGHTEGKMTCPAVMKNGKPCGAKVGEYHWQGTTCTCGVWVAPAFLVPRSRVDRIPMTPTASVPSGAAASASSGASTSAGAVEGPRAGVGGSQGKVAESS
ncbi:hypothetical protein BCR44DRAFT_1434548, partial [Catenaria anguillulae PL171]